MADIIIKVSDEERVACLTAVQQLNNIPHVKYMSIAMIAESAGIKTTKCRAVVDDLVKEEYVDKYQATDNPHLQRYYYIITSKGLELLEKSKDGNEA